MTRRSVKSAIVLASLWIPSGLTGCVPGVGVQASSGGQLLGGDTTQSGLNDLAFANGAVDGQVRTDFGPPGSPPAVGTARTPAPPASAPATYNATNQPLGSLPPGWAERAGGAPVDALGTPVLGNPAVPPAIAPAVPRVDIPAGIVDPLFGPDNPVPRVDIPASIIDPLFGPDNPVASRNPPRAIAAPFGPDNTLLGRKERP